MRMISFSHPWNLRENPTFLKPRTFDSMRDRANFCINLATHGIHMAKYPQGKKTTLKEEDMEQVKAEDDLEPLRSESRDAQVDEPRL
eukprot:11363075-Karenia_brevis.AAC.1